MKKIKSFCAGVWFFITNLFSKVEGKVEPKKARSPRKPTLWTSISKSVETWETCFHDKRVDKRDLSYHGVDAKTFLKNVFSLIPPYGAYCCSDLNEIEEWRIKKRAIDVRACKANTLSLVTIGNLVQEKSMVNSKVKDDSLLFCDGVTIINAQPESELQKGLFVVNEGQLFSIHLSHWTPWGGHSLFYCVVVIDNSGHVHPTYTRVSDVHTVKSRRHGYVSIPCYKGLRSSCDLKMGETVATFFNLMMERNAHWNCRVESRLVPPIAFPIMDEDIARIFPKRQRTGDGKIVHWTRTHKRRTKYGVTSVKAHIRGNIWWEVEGRRVCVTMPGKHHAMPTELRSVVTDKDKGKVYINDFTGIEYLGLKDEVFREETDKSRVTMEHIEIAA